MRKTSRQAVAGIAAAARSSGIAGSTARLTGTLAVACGTEFLMGYHKILDRAPKGRDEGDQPMSWLRRHDEYHNQ